mmetsp:Transcript_27430/g.55436  ORF Transcript_27430/g.55436 Transcript_27430/m.55436 type:complete len:228 (+) Transcript_27430:330-1013(+)
MLAAAAPRAERAAAPARGPPGSRRRQAEALPGGPDPQVLEAQPLVLRGERAAQDLLGGPVACDHEDQKLLARRQLLPLEGRGAACGGGAPPPPLRPPRPPADPDLPRCGGRQDRLEGGRGQARLPPLPPHLLRRHPREGGALPLPRGAGRPRHAREGRLQGAARRAAAHHPHQGGPQHARPRDHLHDAEDPPDLGAERRHDRRGLGALLPADPARLQHLQEQEPQSR